MDCKKGVLEDKIKENGCLIFNYDNVKVTELSKIKELMDRNKGKIIIYPDVNDASFIESKYKI